MDAERLGKLREFGLSAYAAKTYLALLALGTTEARDASRLAKVPLAKIYATLDRLQEKGLVTVTLGQPKKYTPVPFDEFIQRLQERHHEEARALERSREDLGRLFQIEGSTHVGDRGGVTSVRGRRNVLDKLAFLAREAREEILVLGSDNITLRGQVPILFREAHERGVSVKLMARVAEDTLPALGTLQECTEIRAKGSLAGEGGNVSVALYDRRRLVIAQFVPDDGSHYHGKDFGIVLDQEGVVTSMARLLDELWTHAEPLEVARRRLREPARPACFTRFYHTREDAESALFQAVQKGARELRFLSRAPASQVVTDLADSLAQVASWGIRVRGLLPFDAPEAARALQERWPASPLVELRHAEGAGFSHLALVDRRECMVNANGSGAIAADGLSVHTDHEVTVEKLDAQFEAAWAEATRLEDRLAELTRSPTIHPSELDAAELLGVIPEGLLVADAQGNVALWNDALERLLDVRPECGDPVPEVLQPALAEAAGPVRVRHPSAGGIERVLDVQVLPLSPHRLRHLLLLRDATLEARRDAAAQRQDALLQTALELAGAGFYEWKHDSGELYWSEGLYRILGLDPSVTKPDPGEYLARVHPEDLPRVEPVAHQILAGSRHVRGPEEYRIVRPDGEVRHVISRRVRMPGSGNVLGCVRDITPERRRERMLEQAHELLRMASWEVDLQTREVTWSPEMYRLYGVAPGSAPPMEIAERHIHPEDRDKLEKARELILVHHVPMTVDLRIVRADGELRTIQSRADIQRGLDGQPVKVVGVTRDVTPETEPALAGDRGR